jgi:hypothetical protein
MPEPFGTRDQTLLYKIQTLQNRILRMVINAPWYVRNTTVHKDMRIPFVAQTPHTTYLRHHSTLILHPNPLISNTPQHMPPEGQHMTPQEKTPHGHPHTITRRETVTGHTPPTHVLDD